MGSVDRGDRPEWRAMVPLRVLTAAAVWQREVNF